MAVELRDARRRGVRVRGEVVAQIGRGLLLLVAAGGSDGLGEYDRLAEKIFHLRVFPDAEGKMNLDLTQAGGEVLVVPQFTLYGDLRKGRRLVLRYLVKAIPSGRS